MDDPFSRYSRQMLFAPIGSEGQQKIAKSRVVIVGMGALGTVIANHLVRSGVGFIRLIDRDFVELSNLQRQSLYDEEDAASGIPKAIAAVNKLQKINSEVVLEPVVADLNPDNAEKYLIDCDIILDGSDNFDVRYLINDVSFKHSIPWIHGAAVGARGMYATFYPGITPCYRCLFPNPPEGRGETCDTVGVLAPLTDIIGSYETVEALKLLVGAPINRSLEQIDIWHTGTMQMDLSGSQNAQCPACVHRQFDFLEQSTKYRHEFITLCGRNTVQITPKSGETLDLSLIAKRLKQVGKVETNPFLVRFLIDSYKLVFFKDGRVLIQGTEDPVIAKNLYSKYIGL